MIIHMYLALVYCRLKTIYSAPIQYDVIYGRSLISNRGSPWKDIIFSRPLKLGFIGKKRKACLQQITACYFSVYINQIRVHQGRTVFPRYSHGLDSW